MYETLKTFLLNSYDMDGSLDALIDELVAIRDKAKADGITNVRVDSDWEYAHAGDDKVWEVNIIGDKE